MLEGFASCVVTGIDRVHRIAADQAHGVARRGGRDALRMKRPPVLPSSAVRGFRNGIVGAEPPSGSRSCGRASIRAEHLSGERHEERVAEAVAQDLAQMVRNVARELSGRPFTGAALRGWSAIASITGPSRHSPAASGRKSGPTPNCCLSEMRHNCVKERAART